MHNTDAAPLDQDQCYRALCAKDDRFDGTFFVGVSTTGIYCRPVCRVKTPRRSSCTFYPNASAAEAAGFRPCLRCRPELAPYALQENLAYAIWQRIAAGALNDEAMPALAAEVGLSTRQLQRLMQAHFGVSPIELAQTTRLLFAKKLLQETQLGMTEVAYAAGFRSVRRFNALFSSRYGMAPGTLRRGAATPATAPAQLQTGAHITLRLAYRAPYAWDTIVTYLRGRAIGGVETVNESAYSRTLRMQHGSEQLEGWLKVSHLARDHQLQCEVGSQFAPVLMQLVHRLRQQFDLDANPAMIEEQLGSDPLLRKQIAVTPGMRVPGCFDHFELAIRAVLGQQVSVAGASTLAARLVAQFGDRFTTPLAGLTHHFPTPAQLAQLSAEQVAQIGIPKSRALALIALAQFADQGGLEPALGASLEQTVTKLKTVRGIGEWTAQYIALRALRYPDAFPAGDLGLQKAATPPDADVRLSEVQLLQRVAPLSPWRGYAALLLWHSLG